MKPPLLAAASLLLALGACSQQAAAPSGAASQEGSAPVAVEAVQSDVPRVATSKRAPEASADATALKPEGFENIVVGQAPPAGLKADSAQVSDGCQTYSDKKRRFYAMTGGKVVGRITAMQGSPLKTARGIAVGASEAAVRRAYPEVTQDAHKYVDAPAKYLDWRPGGGKAGLRFEIGADGKVSFIHAGREPEITYVEGCA